MAWFFKLLLYQLCSYRMMKIPWKIPDSYPHHPLHNCILLQSLNQLHWKMELVFFCTNIQASVPHRTVGPDPGGDTRGAGGIHSFRNHSFPGFLHPPQKKPALFRAGCAKCLAVYNCLRNSMVMVKDNSQQNYLMKKWTWWTKKQKTIAQQI